MLHFKELKELFKDKAVNEIRKGMKDFPKDHVLFVRRDMFHDNGFPAIVLPNTQEAFLSLINSLDIESSQYELKVSPYSDYLMVEKYYHAPRTDHWVIGFIYLGTIDGIEVPWSIKNARIVDGYPEWRRFLLKKASHDYDNPIYYWHKPAKE